MTRKESVMSGTPAASRLCTPEGTCVMSPVDVQCVECRERFAVSVSGVDDRPQPVCPRCGREEMLVAALAGEDTSWYWDDDGVASAPPRRS